MSHHRFLDLVHAESPAQPAARPIEASGFMACPLVLQTGVWSWQQQIYQLAFEQAQAVVHPSLLERWLRVNPN
jgi:hypothetical protein